MAFETLSDMFTGICDAIREKEGSTAVIPHQNIPDRILGLSTGGECEVYNNLTTSSSTSLTISKITTQPKALYIRHNLSNNVGLSSNQGNIIYMSVEWPSSDFGAVSITYYGLLAGSAYPSVGTQGWVLSQGYVTTSLGSSGLTINVSNAVTGTSSFGYPDYIRFITTSALSTSYTAYAFYNITLPY